MEAPDRELILKFMESDMRLKKLYSRHRKFEEQLDRLSNRVYLSDDEQMIKQKLKKEKLRGVDKMLSIARNHYSQAA